MLPPSANHPASLPLRDVGVDDHHVAALACRGRGLVRVNLPEEQARTDGGGVDGGLLKQVGAWREWPQPCFQRSATLHRSVSRSVVDEHDHAAART